MKMKTVGTIVEYLKVSEDDDSDDKYPLVCVTNQKAKKYITGIQHYFMQVSRQ